MKNFTLSFVAILIAFTTFSQSNSVLYFDGVASKVECGVPAYPNFGSANSFTFECWIKPDGNQTILVEYFRIGLKHMMDLLQYNYRYGQQIEFILM